MKFAARYVRERVSGGGEFGIAAGRIGEDGGLVDPFAWGAGGP